MQGKKAPQDISVRYIKGVGPQKAMLFEKLGVRTVYDLLYYLPRRYEDRSEIIPIKAIEPGKPAGVAGKVEKTSIFRARTGTTIFELSVNDGTGKITAVWYNQPYMKNSFRAGQTVVLYGKPERQKRLQISHPAYEIVDAGSEGDLERFLKTSLDVGRIVPFYSLTEKLNQKYLRKTVREGVYSYAGTVTDPLPTAMRARRKLADIRFAVENIHFPHSWDNLDMAYRRIVFEEFFLLQVVMALKRRHETAAKGIAHAAREGFLEEFSSIFEFELTSGQKKCMKEIEKDMASSSPMHRLLQGDVGSGKTVVAMFAALLSVRNGYQAAVMAPTEILARQHFVTFSQALMPLGVNVRLLVSGIAPEPREMIEKEISSGEADVVIGTHALIQGNIAFRDLGLIVVDEQHKFGVEQRDMLRGKGERADVLVMTATPIPRSLALTVYGDMYISMLTEKPGSRRQVTTYSVGEDRREAVYQLVREEVSAGRQAFFVCPRIKSGNAPGLMSAEGVYDDLASRVFPDLEVDLVHGRMKPEEKDRVMEKFRSGKSDILVATTVIEVGVDIPNVTVMVVEHAERYGLAQLHQLRGRIGRGKHDSYCILVGDTNTEGAYERLSTMADVDDGFAIAEKDLDMRGPGELLGARQSGLPELRVGNIVRDFKIMEEARHEAFSLVENDPGLKDENSVRIAQAVRARFGEETSETL